MSLTSNLYVLLSTAPLPALSSSSSYRCKVNEVGVFGIRKGGRYFRLRCSIDRSRAGGGSSSSSNDSDSSKKAMQNSNYVVPLDKSFSPANSSCITRPLAEILRDLNKRVPDNIINKFPDSDNNDRVSTTFMPWYHANRMLSFYAPGWCGEIRDVIFSENGSVTVVYRVTVRGSDGAPRVNWNSIWR